MADRYLLESGSPDGYLKEDGTGVLLQDPLTYRNTVLADSPIAYWRLGESSGTVATDFIGIAHGAYVNTPTLGVAGLVATDTDMAVTFTRAQTEMVEITSGMPAGGSGGASVEAWIKLASLPTGDQVIFFWNGAGSAQHYLYVTYDGVDAGLSWGFYNGAVTSTGNNAAVPFAVGRTAHVVVTHDYAAKTFRFYLDGVSRSVFQPSTVGQAPTAGGHQSIGKWWGNDVRPFDGTIDEVSVYGSALTAAQAAAHYAAGIATPSIDLVLSTLAPVIGLSVVGASPTALTLATFAPVISAANNQTATPPVVALTLATFAPTVSATANQTATPPTLALTLATFAPTIGLVVVGGSPTALALTTFAPVIKSTIVGASPTALSLSTFAPSVATTAHQVATPGLIALTLATFAPTVTASDHKLATPPTLALSLSTFAPTVAATAHQTATPPTLTLSLSTFAPTVTTDDHKLVTPGVATLSLSTFAPTVAATAHVVATPSTLALTTATFAPTVSATAHRVATPATVTLALSTFAPSVLVPVTITPDVAALLLTGLEPSVFLDIIARPDTLALVLTRYAPDVAAIAIGLPPGLVVTVGMVPGMVADVTMVPGLTASVALDVVDEMEVSVTWAT